MKASPSKPDPDPALIRRAAAGEDAALKDLLREVTPAVRQWALARVGDRDEAEDLVQEILILLVRKLHAFRGESRFLTWLFTIARNQAIEAHRSRGRQARKMEKYGTHLLSEGAGEPQAESDMDRERIRSTVTAFLAHLPLRQREVFQMAELQGLSCVEVGKILGVDPGGIRAALFKARRTLRSLIMKQHPEFVEEYLP